MTIPAHATKQNQSYSDSSNVCLILSGTPDLCLTSLVINESETQIPNKTLCTTLRPEPRVTDGIY